MFLFFLIKSSAIKKGKKCIIGGKKSTKLGDRREFKITDIK